MNKTQKKVNKNLEDYVEQYQALPFEHIQLEFRRKLVLQQISKHSPSRLLEIGCGMNPLFTDLPREMQITVVEPASVFVDRARSLAFERPNVQVLIGFIETVDLSNAEFDMIILSCILHEVPEPMSTLAAVKSYCNPSTVVHVNVPNSQSFHRLLAVAMGLIAEPNEPSEVQHRMQQRDQLYDHKNLKCELEAADFLIIENGAIFIKPFAHRQMQALVDNGFMSSEMLDGLDRLVAWMPEFGSEIWVNVRLKT